MLELACHLILVKLLHQVGSYEKILYNVFKVFMANNLDNAVSTSSSVNVIDAGASLSSDLGRTSASGG